MRTFSVVFLVLLFLGLIVGGMFLGSYNGFVRGEQNVETAWSAVETQYQRRFDLVPNLVNATKGVLKQEQEVFGKIAEARTHYANSAAGSSDRVQATAQYESALSRLLIVMENYPQLRSIESVRALTDELSGTENRVLVARDRYNQEVRKWNTSVKTFPSVFFASIFGFREKVYFQSQESASLAPSVDLNIN